MSDLTAAGGSVKSSVLEREMCALAQPIVMFAGGTHRRRPLAHTRARGRLLFHSVCIVF
jgi:hypothetical protein